MTYENEVETRMDMGALFGAIFRRLPRILIVTALFLVGTYFLLNLVPAKYRSSASILVESRESVFTRANNATQPRQSGLDPSYVPSQIELIRSRDTLMKVIEKENLRDVAEFNGANTSLLGTILGLIRPAPNNQLSDERVLLAVAKNLKVSQLGGSRIITISFSSTDPELAAKIANSIANMHIMLRAELSVSDTVGATIWLEEEIKTMREQVANAEAKVAKYRIDNDLFVGSNNTNVLDQQLTVIATQISQAQERNSIAQSRVDLIVGLLKQGQSLEGVPDVRDSVVIQRLSQDKAGLQGERAQLLATLLPNHPNIQAISAQISEIDKQIRIEARQVANALAAEAKIQTGLEQSLRDDLVRLKLDVSGATQSSVMLNELEREAKAQRDLLNTYLLRFRDASARTDSTSSLPDVRVVSIAAPAIQPASPKKTFILLAVAIVLVVFQILQIISAEFLSGRAIKEIRIARSSNEHKQEITQNPEPINSEHYVAPPMPANNSSFQDISNNDERPISNLRQNAKNGSIKNTNLKRDIEKLSEQIMNNKQQIILVASVGASNESVITGLSANLIRGSKSVVEIDAGTRKVSTNMGITDLCEGLAEYGDIVQRHAKSNFAIVTWGQQANLNRQSDKCKTLIFALNELFDTAIINVGEVGIASSMSAFSGLDALIILVIDKDMHYAFIDNIKQDIHALGLTNVQIIATNIDQTKVA